MSAHGGATSPFVGRTAELGALLDALDRARQGLGGVCLVTGEPGIGKTKLCEELARLASERGVLVAWGACWDGKGAPSHWPWTSALRDLVRSTGGLPPSEPPIDVPALAALLPELARAGEGQDRAADPAGARFAMFEVRAAEHALAASDLGKAV